MIRRIFAVVLAALLLCGGARGETVAPNVESQSTPELPALGELVRLQVVAQDDTPGAQELKLAVRDACLRAAEVCLAGARSADEAFARLEGHLDAFQTAAEDCARQLGFEGMVCAQTGTFAFPDRLYGRLLVPAGEYRALRVILGEGQGHNWWCVLYPSLCRLNEADAAGKLDLRAALAWLKAKLFGGEAA